MYIIKRRKNKNVQYHEKKQRKHILIGGWERETLYGLETDSKVEQQLFILMKLLTYCSNYIELKRFVFNMYLWTESNIHVFKSFERFGLP